MNEYHFQYDPAIPSGRVVFVVHNLGHENHVVLFLELPDDLPPLDAQLQGTARRVLTPYAGTDTRRPGQDGAFAVDLKPGRRYGFICNLSSPAGPIHALLGMNSEFRTG